MKKRYQVPTVTPLQLYAEGNVLQSSVVQQESVVRTKGQPVQEFDFSDDTSFQQDWE